MDWNHHSAAHLSCKCLSMTITSARANKQRQSVVALYPERGPILDRKTRQLAISIAEDSVYGIPEEMKQPRRSNCRRSATLFTLKRKK